MSIGLISKILVEHYPKYLSQKEIQELTGLTKGAVYSNLKRMKKRNEIQTIIKVSKHNSSLITYYRMEGK